MCALKKKKDGTENLTYKFNVVSRSKNGPKILTKTRVMNFSLLMAGRIIIK